MASVDVHWTAYPAAFGGLVAAAVAGWIALRSTWRERRARPKLLLQYHHELGQDFAVGIMDGTQHWVRLRVHNRPAGRAGRRSADDVEVLIFWALRDGESLTQLEGCSFKWSNAFDAQHRPLTRLTIPPGASRRFDLVAVTRPMVSDGGGGFGPVDDEGADGANAELQVQPQPADYSYRLKPGSHSLRLVLTARDTDAAYYDVNIDLDGTWWGTDHIREHVKVGIQRVKVREAS